MAPSSTTPSGAVDALLRDAQKHTVQQLWLANYSDTGGHADEVRGFLRALERQGYEPALKKLAWAQGAEAYLTVADMQMFDRQAKRRPVGPTVGIHEYLPVANQYHVQNAVNVHRVMFETDRIPLRWLTPLLDRDELWVPTQFNVETFHRSGIPLEKLKVVGGTIDFDLFDPTAEPWDLQAPEGAFTFLTNFDFSERKGWESLIRGWAKAFTASDDVCLVLKTGSVYAGDQKVTDRIQQFIRREFGAGVESRLAPIRIMTERLAVADMPRLYAGADAYVLPTRGEGWGRPFMEAMAMGLPTIASNWSAHTEFMDPAMTWLVDGDLVDVPEDADLFNNLYEGHRWFDADPDALAEALRDVASDPAAARAKAAPARDHLLEHWGPEPIARRLDELATAAWQAHSETRLKPVSVAIRGLFGSIDSLSLVNDTLAYGLEEKGHHVVRRIGDAKVVDEPVPGVSQSWPADFEPVTEGPTVMVLHWEFGAARQDWVDEARRKADRVWVSAEYVRQGYIRSGMPPGIIEVLPLGADLERFTPEGPQYELPRKAGTTFLFVGGSTWRKGIDVLLDGWRRAFSPDDDVQLVIKDNGTKTAYRKSNNAEAIRHAAASGAYAPIVYLDEDLPHGELPSLYRCADVVVLPYRAEGFCLPAAEAMACGVPVIHTGTGPTGEFVADIGGWPLPAQEIDAPDWLDLPELAFPAYIQEVDPQDLADTLKAVAADPAARAEKAARAHAQAQNYSLQRFVDRAQEKLARLQAEDLPLARTLQRAEIEAKSHFTVFAPDWADSAAWGPALDAWLDTFGPDDDVTLALWADGDADAIGAAVMSHIAGRDESTLPDLALVQPEGTVTLVSLAATADAVLATGTTDPADNPPLLRRARKIVTPDREAIAELARDLRASATA